MALPLIFAALYLLLSVRILVDARAVVNDVRKGASISLRAWGLRLCLDIPLRMKFDGSSAKQQAGKAKQVWPFVKAVLRVIRWGQTDVRVRIGTKDAAVTAMLCGAIEATGASVQAAAAQRFPCEVRAAPDFSARCFALYGRCIFSFAPGDIMFAVIKAAAKKTQREGFSWLSIPLKA